jgi:hypothetical protein
MQMTPHYPLCTPVRDELGFLVCKNIGQSGLSGLIEKASHARCPHHAVARVASASDDALSAELSAEAPFSNCGFIPSKGHDAVRCPGGLLLRIAFQLTIESYTSCLWGAILPCSGSPSRSQSCLVVLSGHYTAPGNTAQSPYKYCNGHENNSIEICRNPPDVRRRRPNTIAAASIEASALGWSRCVA